MTIGRGSCWALLISLLPTVDHTQINRSAQHRSVKFEECSPSFDSLLLGLSREAEGEGREGGCNAAPTHGRMGSLSGLGSSLLMLLAGWLVRHYELHSTVPSQLLASFTHMEHKVPHPALSVPPSPCPPSLCLSLSGHRVVSAHCARRLHRAGCGILRAVAAPLLAGNRREHVRHTERPSHA